ncbi:MAG: alpha/beta hydrolase [Actinomycetota bacterium]
MPVERTVSADGVSLHAREWTGAERSALLLHGLASTSRIWDFVAPRLAESRLHTVAYDQRGHGRSGKPRSGYGFDRTTADAAAVIRALGLKQPVAVGHSWGANVVLELAVRLPHLVSGAVLIDGGFLNLRDRFDWPAAREALAPPPIAGTPVHPFLHRIRRHLGKAMDVTPAVEAVVLSLVRVDRDARVHPRLSQANHLRILRALWEQDTLGLLRQVRVPTLVLAVRSPPGGPDPTGFFEHKRHAAQLVRAIGEPVRFEWIDGIHDVPLQRPNAVARRILRSARAS